MGFFVDRFERFDEKDFGAFAAKKRASNVYNMERMAIAEKLKLLGEKLKPVFTDRGLNVKCGTSDYKPSIFNGHNVEDAWLYFIRSDEEQRAILPLIEQKITLPEMIHDAAEHLKHSILFVRIDSGMVEAGLRIYSTAWLDVMNLVQITRNTWECAKLLDMVRGLGTDFKVRILPGNNVSPGELKEEPLRELERGIFEEKYWIRITAEFSMEKMLAETDALGVMKGIFSRLVPIYSFITWSRQNDHLSIVDEIRREKIAVQTGVADLRKNDRVVVLGGLFEGKRGVVLDVDAKGFVKVLIGHVTVKFEGNLLRKTDER
ncbi:MAG: mitochondrial 54S ribosomal protein L40 [Deltaproteobacteria bacterium]|nr:mitochondrial 54S ribosomal protein L40 [Deltaproteobacteria bacterium]